MKKWVVGFVLIALLFGMAFADNWEDDYEVYFVMCNPDSYVNVRDFPSKKHEASGYLCYGDRVYTDGKKKNGFFHLVGLNTESGEGWVHGLYLDIWEPMDDVSGKYYNRSNGRVALRNGVNGKRIGWLKSGQEVYVLGMSAEWAVTKKGYVKAEYLEESR